MMTLMDILRKFFRLTVLCLSILSVPPTVTAQQRILWQGRVRPDQINVYTSASLSDRAAITLKQGDVVDVVLQINTMGVGWCQVSFSTQSEPLGYVLCLGLEQNGVAPNHLVHSEPVATQSPATSSTPNLSAATVADSTVLTNKDILDMNRIGLPPEILVAKIKSSQCDFDTSPQQLQQLKLNGLPDPVILAMVQAPLGQSQLLASSTDATPANNTKPVPSPLAAPPTPMQLSQQGDARPCVILKRMGPADEITSHIYSFGIRGKQFQAVEGQLPTGVSFHGRLTDHDVRNIQNKGGKVVVIEPKYTTVDLDHARQECREQ
jgi:hypothetical protein